MVIDSSAQVYNALGWAQQVNSGGTTVTDEYFRVAGLFTGVGFAFTGENSGAPVTLAHVLNGGQFLFAGAFNTFAGRVLVDAVNPVIPPFQIYPSAGLNGIANSIVGGGTMANFGGSGQTVGVFPTEALQKSSPAIVAQMGYVEASSGASSPFFVYDARIPLCMATLVGGSTGQAMNAAATTTCFDGSGNITTPGFVQAGYLKSNLIFADNLLVNASPAATTILKLQNGYGVVGHTFDTQGNATFIGIAKANLVNSVTGYQFNGTAGFTGTLVTSTTCSVIVQGGIITGKTGC